MLHTDYIVVIANTDTITDEKSSEFADLLRSTLENSSFLELNKIKLEVDDVKSAALGDSKIIFLLKIRLSLGLIGNWEGDAQRVTFGEIQTAAIAAHSPFTSFFFIGSPQVLISGVVVQNSCYSTQS
jgi:hypothetical protein